MDSSAVQPGPYLWRNWHSYVKKEVGESFECALYSDSDFTGYLRRPSWPIDLIPALPRPPDGTVRLSLIARVRWALESGKDSTGDDATQDHSFHGGYIDDEIASLLSLALGLRCRSGGITRRWWDNNGSISDPLGLPTEFDHSPPTWIPPRRSRAILPSLQGSASLEDAEDLLAALPSLPGKKAVAVVRAARLYADALWVADSDPNLAWLQLVAAAEVGAVSAQKGTRPVWKRVEEVMPRLWAVLLECGEQHAQKVGTELVSLVRATDRFVNFMTSYQPPPPTMRATDDIGQVQWPDLRNHFIKIYEYRSRALHDGTPFPAPMCEAPVRWAGESYVEKPPWLWSQAGTSTWRAEDIPMYLQLFEYLVRHALLSWWRSLID